MKEARTITIDTLRHLRRAIGAGVLYVGHLFRGLRSRLKKLSNAAGPIPRSRRWRPEGDRRQCVPHAGRPPRRASVAMAMVSCYVADTGRRTAQPNGNS